MLKSFKDCSRYVRLFAPNFGSLAYLNSLKAFEITNELVKVADKL